MRLKKTAASLAFGAMLATPFAYACPPLLVPDTADLNRYQTVFIGEVMNVRQVHGPDWHTQCISGRHHSTYCQSTKNNQTARPEYEVNALPRTSVIGIPSTMVKMMLQGCGEQIPRVRSYGIFFIPKDPKQPTVPIYQSESLLYSNLLLKLGALKPEVSNWDKLQK